jgi:hypothetical protein
MHSAFDLQIHLDYLAQRRLAEAARDRLAAELRQSRPATLSRPRSRFRRVIARILLVTQFRHLDFVD